MAEPSHAPPVRYDERQHPARTLPSQQRPPSLEEQLDVALEARGGSSGARATAQAAGSSPCQGGGTKRQQQPRQRDSERSQPVDRGAGSGNGSSAPSAVVPPAEAASTRGGREAESACRQQLISNVLSWRDSLLSRQASGAVEPPPVADDSLPPPTAFASAHAYQSHFRPLLLMELREELQRDEPNGRHAAECGAVRWSSEPPRLLQPLIGSTATAGSELSAGWSAWEVVIETPAQFELSDLDVLIVTSADSTGATGGGDWQRRLQSGLPALGVVCWREREVAQHANGRKVRLQLALPTQLLNAKSLAKAQGSGGQLRIQKIGSCTSAWREWLVLHRLDSPAGSEGAVNAELLQQLLCAAPADEPHGASSEGADGGGGAAASADALAGSSAHLKWEKRDVWDRLVRAVCVGERLDEDQQSVLRASADAVFAGRVCFMLVQGPPGTGKTTLLRGLLNVLHNAAAQEYFSNVLQAAGAAAAVDQRTPGAASSAGSADLLSRITGGMDRVSARVRHKCARRGRILVCAQSNGAIDELVARLLGSQFVDEYGVRYTADYVRLGHAPADAVREVTLKQRTSQMTSVALGTDRAGAQARTPVEQEARRKQLTLQLQNFNKEQRERSAAREVGLQKQRELQDRIEAAEDRGQPGLVETLIQQHGELTSEERQHAQRIIHLQIEMDAVEASLRAMDIASEHASRQPTSRAQSPVAGTAASGSATNGGGAAVGSAPRVGARGTRQLEREVIDGAHMIFCTLSGAGEAARLAEVHGGFETVIFDEAAQASELSTLIPLQYGAKRVILIGDPQQLPATVVSLEAKRRGYGVPLFERLQRGGHQSRMLRTQYRMHAAIRAFPSIHFYGGALRDGAVVLRAANAPAGSDDGPPRILALSSGAQASYSQVRYSPYAFFNLLDSSQQRGDGRSMRNVAEAKFCVRLILGLVHASDAWEMELTAVSETRLLLGADDAETNAGGGADGSRGGPFGSVCGRVAIITPYREQRSAIAAELDATFGGRSWEHAVDVASVDSYQGREKDIVLYSSVRSGRSGIGFVKDLRRLNVALTRAKHALYVVGHAKSLRQSSTWRDLIDDANARGLSRDVTLEESLRTSPRDLLSVVPITTRDGAPPGGSPRGPPPVRSVQLVR